MPTIVKLKLRTKYRPSLGIPSTENAERVDEVDLDKLTPRARALAEAVAQMPYASKRTGEVVCQHRTLKRRDTTPNPEVWLSPEEMDQPARLGWSQWDKYPANSDMSAEEYLERQARKIPDDWVIVSGAWITGPKQEPVPSMAAGAEDRYLTNDQVLAYMRSKGRELSPSTWKAYYTRKAMPLAPPPDRHVSRTPQWKVETIDAFLDGRWKPAEE